MLVDIDFTIENVRSDQKCGPGPCAPSAGWRYRFIANEHRLFLITVRAPFYFNFSKITRRSFYRITDPSVLVATDSVRYDSAADDPTFEMALT
ncbi:hypothetical protein EVAR_41164_1 [Eumeta japonica]|uniref:Uncharacterized protein n=1 Tax=Eumeta variegata TaxID=151549 RepID=A0A4C1YEQ5_EUMVA|nr:hypothetical protein EVAR_41164_1 [Eumeta japonica]